MTLKMSLLLDFARLPVAHMVNDVTLHRWLLTRFRHGKVPLYFSKYCCGILAF